MLQVGLYPQLVCVCPDLTSYTLEPCSRYPTINTRAVLPFQVGQLFTTDDPASLAALLACDLPSSALPVGRQDASDELPRKRKRRGGLHCYSLLVW